MAIVILEKCINHQILLFRTKATLLKQRIRKKLPFLVTKLKVILSSHLRLIEIGALLYLNKD